MAARKLRPYFQAHTMTILTDQLLRQILQKPECSGRLTKWAIELSEYDMRSSRSIIHLTPFLLFYRPWSIRRYVFFGHLCWFSCCFREGVGCEARSVLAECLRSDLRRSDRWMLAMLVYVGGSGWGGWMVVSDCRRSPTTNGSGFLFWPKLNF